MVVGQVQSGKTGNYTGLICKAADAGYKLIVVLAGIDDSLRSQTQLRLDEGFLGYDTQKRMEFDQTNTRLGVGLLPGVDFLSCQFTDQQRGQGRLQESGRRQRRRGPRRRGPSAAGGQEEQEDPR